MLIFAQSVWLITTLTADGAVTSWSTEITTMPLSVASLITGLRAEGELGSTIIALTPRLIRLRICWACPCTSTSELTTTRSFVSPCFIYWALADCKSEIIWERHSLSTNPLDTPMRNGPLLPLLDEPLVLLLLLLLLLPQAARNAVQIARIASKAMYLKYRPGSTKLFRFEQFDIEVLLGSNYTTCAELEGCV